MRIVEQGHEILAMDPNALALVERAGRTCYKSEDKIGCTVPKEQRQEFTGCQGGTACHGPSCPHHSSNKFVRMLIKRGHHAMLEFGWIAVKFITNRGVTHEMVRHRIASFAQESTRFCDYKDGHVEFIRPVWVDKSVCMEHNSVELVNSTKSNCPLVSWLLAIARAEVHYQELRQSWGGELWPPEFAREVLPNSLKTEIVVGGNLREWRHIMALRAVGTTGKPHPQMQALMLPLLAELYEAMPAMYEDLYMAAKEKGLYNDQM